MMRACVISHSNVHLRQRLFWKSFSKVTGNNVLVISPKYWGDLIAENEKSDNFELDCFEIRGRSMFDYEFSDDAFIKVRDWNPDIIYFQGEVSTNQCLVCKKWANIFGCKFGIFVWENLKLPNNEQENFLDECDFVIAGNEKSKELHKAKIVLPQVGIDTELFKPLDRVSKLWDVVYVGRMSAEKGVAYIKQAFPFTKFVSGVGYDKLPLAFNKARIVVSYSFDTDNWVEQFSPYSNIEAMSCGIPIITSDCGAIPEWLKNSKAIIIPQKNAELLRDEINKLLSNKEKMKEISVFNRDWVVKNFNNKVISKKLCEVFENVFESP